MAVVEDAEDEEAGTATDIELDSLVMPGHRPPADS